MKMTVIIPAAGIGQRFQKSQHHPSTQSKLEMDLCGKPVFIRTLACFTGRSQVHQILLAVHPDQIETYRFKYQDTLALQAVKIIAGSTTQRWDTIRIALNHVHPATTHIAIHDAARPLASPQLITAIFQAAQHFDAVIPGLKISSTLKQISKTTDTSPTPNTPPTTQEQADDPIDQLLDIPSQPPNIAPWIEKTIDRSLFVQAQTPQVFKREILIAAYQKITDGHIDPTTITDDACLLERTQQRVHVIDGESSNLKITTMQDLQIARAIEQTNASETAKALGEKRLFKEPPDDLF